MKRWMVNGLDGYHRGLHEYTSHCDDGLKCVDVTEQVEAEIEKARQEGRDLGKCDAMSEWTPYATTLYDKARADERDRIIQELQGWADREERMGAYADAGTVRKCIKEICSKPRARRAAEPKPLQYISADDFTWDSWVSAFNAVVDVLNKLIRK